MKTLLPCDAGLRRFRPSTPHQPRVFLTHGEEDQRAALAKIIPSKFHLPSPSPALGETIELRA